MESADEGVSAREATAADAAAFAELLVAAWREAGPDAAGFAGATEETIAELTSPEAFRARSGGPAGRIFLAWEKERAVGFSATRRVDEGAVELAGIVVLESRAGLGIGTALVDVAMATAHDDGYRHMVVKTETTNDRARAFYESRGFTVAGVETEHVDDIAVEVWRLTRPLAG